MFSGSGLWVWGDVEQLRIARLTPPKDLMSFYAGRGFEIQGFMDTLKVARLVYRNPSSRQEIEPSEVLCVALRPFIP